MERLASAGDRAAAVAAGERFADRLRQALQIPPSRETRALLDDLRRAPAAPVAPPAALARPYDTTFAGRRAELARLQAAWAGVRTRGDRRLALLAGEPGVGKTRLAHQFANAVLADGATVLLGRCSEEPLAPFEPFADALRQAGAGEALRPGKTDDAGARHRLFDGVDAALSALAPLALVVDDLHWADRGTLLLTRFLLRSARRGPVMVVGTYRDTEPGRRTPLTGALAELEPERIVLAGLARAEVASLARDLLGDDEQAARIHERTGGNAFFAEEVLRGLAVSGSGDVPQSVRHAVGVRLARLSEDANALLVAAAILGLEHDAGALEATAGLDPAAAEAALERGAARTAAAARRDGEALRVLACARARRRPRRAQRAPPRPPAPPRGRRADGARRGPPPGGDRRPPVRGGVDGGRAPGGRHARARRSPCRRAARLRGRRRALRPGAGGARPRGRRGRAGGRAARPRRRAPARRRAGRRAGGVSAARGRSRTAAATPSCSPRPRSASPGPGSRSSTSTRRRSRGSRRRSRASATPCCAPACRRGSRSSSTTPPTADAPRR